MSGGVCRPSADKRMSFFADLMAVVDSRHKSIRAGRGFDIGRWRGTAEVDVQPDRTG
jgi:hypothetical protein